jgi:hypothetical protein
VRPLLDQPTLVDDQDAVRSSDRRKTVRDEAALSLGASRRPEAITKLIEAWKRADDREFKSVLLRSLGSSRRESAIDFLLDLVRSGLSQDATQALDALRLHDPSEEIQVRIEQARSERE